MSDMQVVDIKPPAKWCNFCTQLVDKVIVNRHHCICPNCISKARRLVSENDINGTESYSDIDYKNEL